AYRTDFAIFGVLAILFLQSTILQFSLASHMMHHYSVGSVAIQSVGKLIAYGLIALFGVMTLRAAILADIAAYACGNAFLWTVYRRTLTPGLVPQLEPSERKRLRRYAVYN